MVPANETPMQIIRTKNKSILFIVFHFDSTHFIQNTSTNINKVILIADHQILKRKEKQFCLYRVAYSLPLRIHFCIISFIQSFLDEWTVFTEHLVCVTQSTVFNLLFLLMLCLTIPNLHVARLSGSLTTEIACVMSRTLGSGKIINKRPATVFKHMFNLILK